MWSNSSRCRIVSVYLLWTWCLYNDHCLYIVIIIWSSINCPTVICLPTICYFSREKPLVKPMAPGSLFHHISSLFHHTSFRSTILAIFYFPIYKPKIPKIFTLLFIYLYQVSLLQVTMKGLTTPLSHWVQVVWLFVQVFGDLCIVSYWIDTLVLKVREILISTLMHHPLLFKGKTNASSRSSKKNFWCRSRGDLRQVKTYQVPIINSYLLHYVILHSPLVFLSTASQKFVVLFTLFFVHHFLVGSILCLQSWVILVWHQQMMA